MGRHSEYKPEYVGKVDEYLALCVDEPYQLIKSEGERTTAWDNRTRVKLPTIEGFADYIDVNDDTLNEWRKVNPDFSAALMRITRKQKEKLLDNGLSGDYNPLIAKLILATNHGMREGVDVTSGGEKMNGVVFMPTPHESKE